MDKVNPVALVAFTALLTSTFMFGDGAGYVDWHWRIGAIERGYGLHCPDTGKYAWKEECE